MTWSDQTFSETMRRVRKAQGITLEELARRTAIRPDRLRAIDAGDHAPYLIEADRIASALHTTIDCLVHGSVTTYALGAFRRIADTLPTNTDNKGESNEIHD